MLVAAMDDRLIGHLPGKAAIDHAMWDLRGKLLGQPVARLLGGVKQHVVPVVPGDQHGHAARKWPTSSAGWPISASGTGS